MNYPAEIAVEVLQKTSPGFDAETLKIYNALYKGGKCVHDNKIMDGLLSKRDIEKTPQGSAQYDRRKKRSPYVNRAGGMIDFFVASCYPQDPKITTSSPSPYFESLNLDCDGLGTPFCTLARNLLRETLITRRSYVRVDFPSAEGQVSPADDEALGAVLTLVPATVVDDWQTDLKGRLEWVRLHNLEQIRDPGNPIAGVSKDRHTWTFYDGDQIAIYEALADLGGSFGPKDKARMISRSTHDFGRLPIFDLRASTSSWVMDRTFDVIKALFEREAGVTWALDAQCYAIPVLTLPNIGNIPTIFGNELMALVLENGSTLTFSAPPANIFEPLFRDIERLSSDLYETVQSMAINAAAIPQAGRLSGEAVDTMRKPLTTLLKSFAWPVKEALQRTLEALAKYRGEDLEITLEGFDNPSDVQMEDLKEAVDGSKPEPETEETKPNALGE